MLVALEEKLYPSNLDLSTRDLEYLQHLHSNQKCQPLESKSQYRLHPLETMSIQNFTSIHSKEIVLPRLEWWTD